MPSRPDKIEKMPKAKNCPVLIQRKTNFKRAVEFNMPIKRIKWCFTNKHWRSLLVRVASDRKVRVEARWQVTRRF